MTAASSLDELAKFAQLDPASPRARLVAARRGQRLRAEVHRAVDVCVYRLAQIRSGYEKAVMQWRRAEGLLDQTDEDRRFLIDTCSELEQRAADGDLTAQSELPQARALLAQLDEQLVEDGHAFVAARNAVLDWDGVLVNLELSLEDVAPTTCAPSVAGPRHGARHRRASRPGAPRTRGSRRGASRASPSSDADGESEPPSFGGPALALVLLADRVASCYPKWVSD